VFLAIGSKGTPFETAFLNAMTQRSKGHITSLALLEPNLPSKPITLIANEIAMRTAAWSRSSSARSMPRWRTGWSIWWRTERSRKKNRGAADHCHDLHTLGGQRQKDGLREQPRGHETGDHPGLQPGTGHRRHPEEEGYARHFFYQSSIGPEPPPEE